MSLILSTKRGMVRIIGFYYFAVILSFDPDWGAGLGVTSSPWRRQSTDGPEAGRGTETPARVTRPPAGRMATAGILPEWKKNENHV